MPLSNETRTFIVETIQRIFSEPHPRILLFGSQATGQARPTSDIDIAIDQGRPLAPSLWARLDEAFEESDLVAKVDIVDYQRVGAEFRSIIDRTAVPLTAS